MKRPPPIKDEKILASWNGLMISAFSRAGFVLARPDYAERAGSAADFILRQLRSNDGRLMRSFKDGKARHNAYLDDYAFLIQGLLDLYEATFEATRLEQAIALQSTLDFHFEDSQGGYFMTSDDHEQLLVRDKPSYDGAEPSGNSVAALNVLRLEEFTTKQSYRKRAEASFEAFAGQLSRGSTGLAKMLVALDYYLDSPLEVLIVTPESNEEPGALLSRLRQTFLPNRILAVAAVGSQLERTAKLMPLFASKLAIGGKATAFVCEKGCCELPTSDPTVFARQIAKVKPLLAGDKPQPLAVAAPGREPKPWQYDPKTNKHWNPDHRHWHDGRPPQQAGK